MKEEGYVQPAEFFFSSVVTSFLIGLLMSAAARSGQTEGRQTMFGIPKTDVERLVSHYGISVEEAEELLATYPVDLLLPPRGSGLAPVEMVGSSQDELVSGLMMMEDGMRLGEKARITLCTEAMPTDDDLATAYLNMVAGGCHVSYPTVRVADGIPTTEFILQKGSPVWAAVIPLIVPILTIGLVAWGITKVESLTKALMPLILVTIGGVIALAAIISKPATKYIERGGKVPYLPSTNLKKVLAAK